MKSKQSWKYYVGQSLSNPQNIMTTSPQYEQPPFLCNIPDYTMLRTCAIQCIYTSPLQYSSSSILHPCKILMFHINSISVYRSLNSPCLMVHPSDITSSSTKPHACSIVTTGESSVETGFFSGTEHVCIAFKPESFCVDSLLVFLGRPV